MKRRAYLSLENELVRGVHLSFLLLKIVDKGSVEAETGRRGRESGLGGLANLLGGSGRFSGGSGLTFGRRSSGFGLHGFGNGLLRSFLDEGSTFEREASGKVETSLDLDELLSTFSGSLDTLDSVLSDPRVDSSGERLRVGVLGLEFERLRSSEGEDLGRRNGVSDIESEDAGSLISSGIGRSFPGEFDGEELSVEGVEFSDLEDGGDLSASEGGTTSDSLVLVRGEGEGSTEEVLNALLEGRDTGRSSNEFDRFDVLL